MGENASIWSGSAAVEETGEGALVGGAGSGEEVPAEAGGSVGK